MSESELIDTFEDFFSTIDDPRLERSKLHPLNEILFLALVGVLCGVQGWKALEYFGQQQINLLQSFYPYLNGIPSDDTLRRVFRRLGHRPFRMLFNDWVSTLSLPDGLSVAIDGKTSRSSKTSSGGLLHTVTAYASEHQLVLGQMKTADKSNEITAIPKLLDTLSITNATITIDAMGCQKDICNTIIAKESDYCIAVKQNQPNLYSSIIMAFSQNKETPMKIHTAQQITKGHGRIERRVCEVMACSKEFLDTYATQWAGLQTIIKITSFRTLDQQETCSTRYYISSTQKTAKEFNKIIRSHWAIENNLHWILDTSFNDDSSTISKGNAPINLLTIKHFALNLLQRAKTKTESIKMLPAAAGWNKNTLLRILSKIKDF